MAGDADFIGQLRSRYPVALEKLRFRLVELPLGLLAAMTKIEPLSFYAKLPAGEEGGPERYDLVRRLRDAFQRGALPEPIVVSVDFGRIQLLDGFHRASAAVEAGLRVITAFEHVHPGVVLVAPDVSNLSGHAAPTIDREN